MWTNNKMRNLRSSLTGIMLVIAAAGCSSTRPAPASLPDNSDLILQTNFQARKSGGYWIMVDGRRAERPQLEGFHADFPAPNLAPNVKDRGFVIAHGDGGFWILRDYGLIEAYGDAPTICKLLYECTDYKTGKKGNPVAVAPTPSGRGFWVVGYDGKVWTVGDAQPYGDVTRELSHGRPSSIAPTPTGHGYYILHTSGYVSCRGDAASRCWKGKEKNGKNRTAVGIALSLDLNGNVNGFWTALDDGAVFTGGCAPSLGSTGGKGNEYLFSPVEDLKATPDGRSYAWLWVDGRIERSRDQSSARGQQGGDDRRPEDGSCTKNS